MQLNSYKDSCFWFQIQSGLGKMILKEEMEKEMIRERHARSLSAQRFEHGSSNAPQYNRFILDVHVLDLDFLQD